MADKTDVTSMPWPALVAVFLALGGGAALYLSPLKSERPGFSSVQSQSLGCENVQARLWEDPFQAAQTGFRSKVNENNDSADHVQTSPSGDASAPIPSAHSVQQIKSEIDDPAFKGDVLILPVMIQGNAYPEVTEQRLRTRVAVLEGLGIRGYKPVDTAHIGYFLLDWPNSRLETPQSVVYDPRKPPGGTTSRLLVPYEWCESGHVPMAGCRLPQHSYERVLVLWLNEDVFYDFPITRLGWLLQQVIPKKRNPDVSVLGPYISTTLRAMIEEASKMAKQTKPERQDSFPDGVFHGTVRMLSPWATACDEALRTDSWSNDDRSAATYLSEQVSGNQFDEFRLERATHTDLEVCQELVAELYRRQVELPTGKCWASHNQSAAGTKSADDSAENAQSTNSATGDNVAVIGEWDTVFGRALPLTFAAVASGQQVSDLVAHPERVPTWIRPYVYLRGIDGRIQSGSSELADTANVGSEQTSRKNRGGFKLSGPDEQPEGTDQTDYLRRLADQLVDWDTQLRRDGKHLSAVGILGTDLYDKLLVLRALRDRLPADVIFFTTDLDARYQLPSEWKTAHNLVICSSYGLSLDPYFQGNIPPFRDSLQTAAFVATVAAVDPKAVPNGNWQSALDWPRVFEIGRTAAFNMSVDRKAATTHPTTRPMPYFGDVPETLQPARHDLESWFGESGNRYGWVAGLVISLGLFILLYMLLGLRPRGFQASYLLSSGLPFLILATTAISILVAYLVSAYQVDQEPFAWFEGVSLWPTECLRLLAALLSIHFYFKAEEDLRESNQQVQKTFNLKEPAKSSSFWGTFFRTFNRWDVYGRDGSAKRFASPAEVPVQEGVKVYAQDVWNEYHRRADRKMRFLRVVLASVFYLIIAFFAMGISGLPHAPVRGSTVYGWDIGITAFSVILSVVFTFFVVDGTFLNAKIIDLLMKKDTHWPDSKHRPMHVTKLEPEELKEYSDIQFIAMRTRVAGKIVYFPFLIFFILIVSRLSIFANWDWPLGLLIIFVSNVSLAAFGAYLLRVRAERARALAVRKLHERRLICLEAGNEPLAEAFRSLAKAVELEKEGAFSLLSQYPLVAALILPSSGIGLWVILQQLSQNFGAGQ